MALAVLARERGKTGPKMVNISNNTLITDWGTCGLLKRLRSSLEQLNCAGCLKLGPESSALITKKVSTEWQRLRALNLASVKVARNALLLSKAVALHPSIQDLNLSNISLPKYMATDVALTLLESTLTSVDLGWNSLPPKCFETLGDCLPNSSILYLSLANSVGATPTVGNPCTFFLRALGLVDNLVSLDIGSNRLDAFSIVVLEDAIASQSSSNSLLSIDLSNNPLGAQGLRSVLRSFALPSCSLRKLRLDNIRAPSFGSHPGFLFSNPQGVPNYDASRPPHRAVFSMLQRLQQRAEQSPFALCIEQKGKDMVASLELRDEKRPPNATRLLEAFDKTFKMDINKRNVRFGRLWESLEHGERLLFLDALSKDFMGSFAELQVLAQSLPPVGPIFPSEVIIPLFNFLEMDNVVQRYMTLTLIRSVPIILQLISGVRCLLEFNPLAP